MAISPTQAIKAFDQAARLGGSDGLEARAAAKGSSFAELMSKAVEDTVTTGKKAEQLTAEAIVGEADVMDVVTAVSNAEITLQTVVTIRDRVINAYQEIMRMPI